jgi:hypothetical protein
MCCFQPAYLPLQSPNQPCRRPSTNHGDVVASRRKSTIRHLCNSRFERASAEIAERESGTQAFPDSRAARKPQGPPACPRRLVSARLLSEVSACQGNIVNFSVYFTDMGESARSPARPPSHRQFSPSRSAEPIWALCPIGLPPLCPDGMNVAFSFASLCATM